MGTEGNDIIICRDDILEPKLKGCVMAGLAGKDKMKGSPRDDVMCGGSDDDEIYYDGGTHNIVDGGSGNDLISP